MELRFHTPLSPEEQIAAGLETAQPLALADKVRYSEIDVLNHVNNKAYMSWFETLRVAYYDRFMAHHYQGRPAPRTVLRNADIHYVREMLADESYIATARVTSFRNTSYGMEQQIWSGGQLRCRMKAVMVLRTSDGSAGYPIPVSLAEEFRTRDGAVRD
jgi:acyl-CoA thioester hydrolase